MLEMHNRGEKFFSSYDDYVIDRPWVELENFHLSAPAIAFVEVTNLCNLTCSHCYAWSGPRRHEDGFSAAILSISSDLSMQVPGCALPLRRMGYTHLGGSADWNKTHA